MENNYKNTFEQLEQTIADLSALCGYKAGSWQAPVEVYDVETCLQMVAFTRIWLDTLEAQLKKQQEQQGNE